MNITMFLMIHLCVKVKRMNANTREHTLRGKIHLGMKERNEIYLLTHLFLPRLGDELQLPKVMTDTDTVASVSTDAGVLKRARSRHYLNGKSRRANI